MRAHNLHFTEPTKFRPFLECALLDCGSLAPAFVLGWPGPLGPPSSCRGSTASPFNLSSYGILLLSRAVNRSNEGRFFADKIHDGRLNGISVVKDNRLPHITGLSLNLERMTRSRSSRCSPFNAQKTFPLKLALSHRGRPEYLILCSGLIGCMYTAPHPPHLHSPFIFSQFGVM
jgi:hypothetical protein